MKWGKSYGEEMGWLRASLSLAIITATDLCPRGSHIRWRSDLDMADGIGLPYSRIVSPFINVSRVSISFVV